MMLAENKLPLFERPAAATGGNITTRYKLRIARQGSQNFEFISGNSAFFSILRNNVRIVKLFNGFG